MTSPPRSLSIGHFPITATTAATPPASEPLPLPPDITVTRADVEALPVLHQDDEPPFGPSRGHSWHVVRVGPGDVGASQRRLAGRLVWVEMPEGLPFSERCTIDHVLTHNGAAVTRMDAAIAERAYVWQVTTARAQAFADMDGKWTTTLEPQGPCVTLCTGKQRN